MNKTKLSLSVLLLCSVLVLGCIGERNVTVDANDGLKITEFSANPISVDAGDPVIFSMTTENQGGTTATGTVAVLYGVENTWLDSSGNLVTTDDIKKNLGTLKPPVPSKNMIGGMKMAQWQLVAPNPGQGYTAPYNVEVRLFYGYNTSGFLQITALSNNEYERLMNLGEVPELPTIMNSAGPLQMDVPSATKYQNIVVDFGDEDEYTYPFKIVFKNVGTGWPITPELDGSELIGGGGRLTGTISLQGPAEFSDCLGATSGTTVNLDDAEVLPRIRGATRETAIPCEIKFDKNTWADRAKDYVKLVFNIYYKYYTKEVAVVNVVGK